MKLIHQRLRWLLSCVILVPLFGCAHTPSACCGEGAHVTTHTTVQAWTDEEPVEGFDPTLLYLLDHQNTSFLFRGNSPAPNDHFTYDQLKQGIKTYLSNQNIAIADDFKIMDLSFLNYITESGQIEAEKDWFSHHPETGCYWLHSLFGALVNPVHLSKSVRDFIIEHHDVDGLKTLMHDIKSKLDTPCSSNFVIYIHCKVGKDRTGEASACYLMEYKGYSYKDAIALDQKIAGRDLRELSMNAIRWYAFFLRDIKHKTWIGAID